LSKQLENLILSTAYFPPISYFRLLACYDIAYIEMCENYIKQTYRNRCVIHSSNGPLPLSVPVERGSFHKVQIRDLKIDYSKNWQRLHLRALDAGYQSSAFYEFYIDEIREIILKNHTYLVDLNGELLIFINQAIGIEPEIRNTESFVSSYHNSNDMRYNFSPKVGKASIEKRMDNYFQVFAQENGFLSDLSIIDLLFNLGSESYGYIKKKG
jgi:hypothetical protein